MDVTRQRRVVLAHLGMEFHWEESISFARALRDAGMEVIYLGSELPEGIVQSAIQEDADVVALSTFSGDHMTLGPRVVKLLLERGAGDITVVLCGNISSGEIAGLKEKGIADAFGPGTTLERIVACIKGGER